MADLSDLLSEIEPFAPGCPAPAVEDAVRRAMRRFCNESWWLRRNASFSTVADTGTYNVANTADLELVALVAAQITQDNGNVRPLCPVVLGSISTGLPAGQPIWYAYQPYNDVVLSPTPNAVSTVQTTFVVQPTRTTELIPDELMRKWYQGIAAGALEWLQRLPGQPWNNPNEAERNAAVFRAAISNAKADVQRSYLAGGSRARGRRFLTGGFSMSGTAFSVGSAEGYVQNFPDLA